MSRGSSQSVTVSSGFHPPPATSSSLENLPIFLGSNVPLGDSVDYEWSVAAASEVQNLPGESWRFTVSESSSQQHLSYLKISKSLGFQPPTVQNPQYWNTLTSCGSQSGLGSIRVSGMDPRDRSGFHCPSETEPIVCTLPSLQLFGSWAPNLLKSSGSIWN